MIVDFHIHAARRADLLPQPLAFCDSFWEGRGDWDAVVESAAGLDEYLEGEGVDFGVLLAEDSPLTTGVTRNEDLWARLSDSHRAILFCNLNPWHTPDLAAEVHRLAGLGFRGIKLYPTYQHVAPNDARLYPLYGACQELGWPVMVHTGSSVFKGSKVKYGDPVLLDDVVVDFPKLKVLAVHGGRGLWYEQAAFLAQLHDNLYLEIAGLPPRNLLEYFPDLERLSHKVVFGSDWPANPGIRSNAEAIRALPLSDDAKSAILGGNAARILGLGVA